MTTPTEKRFFDLHFTRLTPTEKRLFDHLYKKLNNDVPIHEIYIGVLHYSYDTRDSPRVMQQRAGPVITRINRKLPNYKIVPGKLKRTYRLIPKV